MVRFLKSHAKAEAARQRYPEMLCPLLSMGQPDEDTDYRQLAEPMADYVSDLIQMALDDDLNQREEDDPAVWAPLHAMYILGELGAAEAAEPLSQCLGWEDEWVREALPKIYAGLGPVAVPTLETYLEDTTHDVWGRIRAVDSLATIGQAHDTERDAIVRYLTDYLDRPTADDNADEELLTTFAISGLADLEASEAYPAIKRAFDEDRVDLQVICLEDVEVDFGMRPKPDYDKLEPPQEPGVRLALKCKACGRERSYLFPKVYCDLGTVRNKKKLAKYGPIIIPQSVVCSKCGAVDQYELSGLGQVAIMADLLSQTVPELRGFRQEDQRVQYMQFEAMGRKMHPLEAIERYQAKIARHPDDSDLYVGYGNVLRFLGRFKEAMAQYQRAQELDPLNPSGYMEMAILEIKQRNRMQATRLLDQVIEVTRSSRLSNEEKFLFLEAAQAGIKAIRTGKEDEFAGDPIVAPSSAEDQLANGFERPTPKRARGESPATKIPLPKRVTPKSVQVRRNDPCPCGSGKKYKHCCMKKQ
jgi:tetratricopeptide (TPR) repeat protein